MSISVLSDPSLITISLNLLGLSFCFFAHGASHPLSSLNGDLLRTSSETSELQNLSQWFQAFSYFLLGMCVFCMYEWLVHFFVYHGWKVRLTGVGWQLHMRHHHYPEKLLHVPHSISQQYLWVVLFTISTRLIFFYQSNDVIAIIVSGNLIGLYLHEVAHLHAHGHPFLVAHIKFLEPCRRYHSYHHYSCEDSKVAFGLVTPWVDYVTGYLPPYPSASPFHCYSKHHNSSLANTLTHRLMRLPLPVPFMHWICMYSLSQDGDF